MNTLLEALRAATRESHRQLEDALRLESTLDNPAAYRRLLERFFGIYEPLEAALGKVAGLAETGYSVEERTKLPALRRDLAELGTGEESAVSLPRCPVPPVTSVGMALGLAYVLEGSTLGGQSITRMVEGRGAKLPTHFFNVYGPQTRDRWLAFQETLRRLPEDDRGGTGAAAGAATQLFTTFQQWLTES